MQDFSNNSGVPISDADKSRKRNDIQREIVMLESDLRKVTNEKNSLEMEIRALKKEDAQIKITLREKEERKGKVDFEVLQRENEIRALRKKLNLI